MDLELSVLKSTLSVREISILSGPRILLSLRNLVQHLAPDLATCSMSAFFGSGTLVTIFRRSKRSFVAGNHRPIDGQSCRVRMQPLFGTLRSCWATCIANRFRFQNLITSMTTTTSQVCPDLALRTVMLPWPLHGARVWSNASRLKQARRCTTVWERESDLETSGSETALRPRAQEASVC